MRTVLTIAGSDSGGGAGIQADLKTFEAHGVFGTTAITAVTAQNTTGVARVHALPPGMVTAQIDAVVTDLGADAVKIGMLANARIVDAVARAIERHQLTRVVLDPVMIAKGGASLLDRAAVEALRARLVPLADRVTANVPEAEVLLDEDDGRRPLRTVDDLRRAARTLVASGAQRVVVKGGHLDGPAVDVFFDGTELLELSAERIDTSHTHGTGCTFAAAIAARLALDDGMADAVRAAKAYVTRAIVGAPGLGHGHGPVRHRLD